MATRQTIGPYIVVREIGRGGMGTVYEARDPRFDRPVALKLISAGRASEMALERFWREAEALAKVHHRSVVRIHDMGQLPEGPYMIQELIEGEPLEQVARREPRIDPRTVAGIMRDLCEAVSAVHHAGILHRDLKPANVLLRSDGVPVLLDFGLARDVLAESLTKTGAMLGTPVYMAPEQAKGEKGKGLDERTDVYGLGAILYELLTGQPPFAATAPLELVGLLLYQDPDWPRAVRSSVPAGLDAICRAAMAKAPAERYSSALAMREDIERFLAGQVPEAQRSAARAMRSRRGAWALLAGLILLIAVLLLALSSHWPTERTRPALVEAPPPEARTRRAPPPAADLLWTLVPGERLGTLRLTYSEDDSLSVFEFVLDLETEVRGELDERGFALECTVRRIRSGVGSTGAGLNAYDSQAPDLKHPLAAFEALVGRRFDFTLDPRTGAVAGLQGLQPAIEAINPNIKEGVLGFPVSWSQAYVERTLRDEHMEQILDALLHVAPNATPRVTWGGRAGSYFLDRAKAHYAILPAHTSGRTMPEEPYRLEGKARYADGRLVESGLEQELLRKEKLTGPPNGKVSTLRARIELLPE